MGYRLIEDKQIVDIVNNKTAAMNEDPFSVVLSKYADWRVNVEDNEVEMEYILLHQAKGDWNSDPVSINLSSNYVTIGKYLVRCRVDTCFQESDDELELLNFDDDSFSHV
jgi:hypothetical protein